MIRKCFISLKRTGIKNTIIKSLKYIFDRLQLIYHQIKHYSAPVYRNPNESELTMIETNLNEFGVETIKYWINVEDFNNFSKKFDFSSYYKSRNPSVWHEKMLEHFVAFELLNLKDYKNDSIYVDVAAAGSPWAKMLRKSNITAFAIDIVKSSNFSDLPYYLQTDATRTCFSESSIKGVSLQCALEMFAGCTDQELIVELKRILKPGGKAIISPLYMHTHACHYATPEFYGRGHGDNDSKEYIRRDCSGIKTSRKYDPLKLKTRILDLIHQMGMSYKIYVIQNKSELNPDIYLHFILEITK